MWEKVNLDLGIYYSPFSAILKFPPEVDNKGERYGPTSHSLKNKQTNKHSNKQTNKKQRKKWKLKPRKKQKQRKQTSKQET